MYYFLTTRPRQEIPVDSTDILGTPIIDPLLSGGKGGRRIISPSLSNPSVDDDQENAEDRRRAALSPSPEVDLSAHELDAAVAEVNFTNPPTPAASFSGRSSLARDGSSANSPDVVSLSHNHRAASPPLEGDEKEFTQTASNMRMRGMSLDGSVRPSLEGSNPEQENVIDMQIDETEEEKAKRNSEAAAYLFGAHPGQIQIANPSILSSPLLKPGPAQATVEKEIKVEDSADVEMEEPFSVLGDRGFGLGWDTREPESIGLEELDDLFGAI